MAEQQKSTIPEKCPHCGSNLSSWEQTLLSVDRALVCKSCWYSIILLPSDQVIVKEKDKPDKKQ
jgi:DNA-directed RNA polymerase subunit RPC12/RpoP